jgi:integrase
VNNKKLYTLTSAEFRLPFHQDHQNNIITQPANDIPMMFWPDGSWCLLANFYMQDLFSDGFSRKNGGGTLKVYAANLSHLIRFCFYNKTDFYDLTDNQFTFFIITLASERSSSDPSVLARSSNHVIAIGRVCLEFLSQVGEWFSDLEFVSKNGQIRAHKVVIEDDKDNEVFRRSRKRKKSYWHHSAFPTASEKKSRSPITIKNISNLHNAAVVSNSNNFFILKRRFVMLKLLESTGCRRIELTELKVDDVYNALNLFNIGETETPMLQFVTAKTRSREWEFRKVAIPLEDLRLLIEFIEVNRYPTIKKLVKNGKLAKDEGYVFISMSTGNQLRSNTITQEVYSLTKNAGIIEKVCAQMFRHRFITLRFVDLLMEVKLKNPNGFWQGLINIDDIKTKVQQSTGHKNRDSLDNYIDLAFDEILHYSEVKSGVLLRNEVDSVRTALVHFSSLLKSGVNIEDLNGSVIKILDDFAKSLNRFE